MATIKTQRFRRVVRRHLAHGTITSVDVTIALTAAEASLLPPSTHVKPHFPGATTVDSTVERGGGELILRYHTSSRPYGGARAETIPTLALRTAQAWLAELASS